MPRLLTSPGIKTFWTYTGRSLLLLYVCHISAMGIERSLPLAFSLAVEVLLHEVPFPFTVTECLTPTYPFACGLLRISMSLTGTAEPMHR